MNHSFDIDLAQKFGLNEAILLENIRFWIQKNRANESHHHEGRTWTYNSVAAFREIFPYMGPKAIRAALERLVEGGVLQKGNYNVKSIDQTTWYAFVDEAIYLKGQMDCPKRANGLPPRGKSTICTDITTDITADNIFGERDIFAEAWAIYPKRPGANRSVSLKAWNARIASGADPELMLAGTKRYAAYVTAKQTEPNYIKQASTFFGPDEHFASDWTVYAANSRAGPSAYQQKQDQRQTLLDRVQGKKNAQPAFIDIN